ncbi:MAG: hypothetical protein AAB297_01255 [Acidobacteriota bacterium]
MKKVLAVSALLLGFALATPALADHRGHNRGHRVVRGGYHSVHHHNRPRPHASVFFRVGRPAFAFGLYAPAPFVMTPGYCHPVWVPGHSIRDRGARVWIAGYWSR